MNSILKSDNPIAGSFLDYRERTGLSQAKAAAIFCNRNVKRWRDYEKGRSLPPRELGLLMMKLTLIPADQLIGDLELARAYAQKDQALQNP